MAYGPGVLDQLQRGYTLLHDSLINKGVNVWYGEAGNDEEVAIMLLNNTSLDEIKQYLIENYADTTEDEDDED
jgi:hypothetical protein